MLAELMRLQFSVAVGGTHGKTTTTSMIATLLDAGGMDPTVVNGGIINAYGTNAKVGEGDWIVVEADESDGTFLKLKSTVAVVTNIDPEHLDHYGDFDSVKRAFRDFVENIPFYGFAAVCLDHPEVQAMTALVQNRRLVTYGVNPQAEVRAASVVMDTDGCHFDVIISPRDGEPIEFKNLHLPMAGWHNVSNALAAIAVARELSVSEDHIRKGLAGFGGVKRRFTTTAWRTAFASSTTTPTTRWRSPRSCAPPARWPPARSSPWCSRTAIRACTTSSRSSAAASTTPTPWSSPTSTRPARRRWRGSTRTT
jgi:UDP-N-acetylmuramate--alanine ligase